MDVLAYSTLAYARRRRVNVARQTANGPRENPGPGQDAVLPLEGDDLTMLVLAMQNGIADLEELRTRCAFRLTEMMRRVDEPMYIGLVEQGDVEPLEAMNRGNPGRMTGPTISPWGSL